jgi:diguanylate cyclase (GGDEF)-like protein
MNQHIEEGDIIQMKRKIRILRVSNGSFAVTIILAVLFFVIAVTGSKEFHILKETTNKYITCEKSAKELQAGSDYLTEQVRLYVMTGDEKYMKLYLNEVHVTKRREKSLKQLKKYFDKTVIFTSLQKAMECSNELMNTEYYAMRLIAEEHGVSKDVWPKELKQVQITDQDEALSAKQKQERAQKLVRGKNYQERRAQISAAILVIMMLVMCILVRRLVVWPLVSYNDSIKRGEIFPVIGAAELQSLAETYNHVYKENQETQKLIRHQAEHDAMTDLLNRGSFEKPLKIHKDGSSSYALLLIDVDTFKTVNDTYGHDMGDQILKKVADLLKKTFRSIDYVCRIGGDEFAIIMVEMTSDLEYTVMDKISAINEKLSKEEDGLPAVSSSVQVAKLRIHLLMFFSKIFI